MTADNENQPSEDDGFEDEFSLERLSEAYAQVIRQNAGDEPQSSRGELVSEKVARQSAQSVSAAEETLRSVTVVDDDAACPLSPESIVEAILFVGCPRGEKLTTRKIASTIRDVSPSEVKKIATALNEKYQQQNRAWRIDIDDNTLRMKIAEDLASLQASFHGRDKEASLSQNAIDVLAIIAYQQPATRELVDQSREKPSAGIIRQLVKRNLIAEEPLKDSKGKAYRTTDRFLELLRLESLDDLPQSQPAELDDFED